MASDQSLPVRQTVSADELEAELGFSAELFRKEARLGRMPGALRCGKNWRFYREEVIDALRKKASGRSRSSSPPRSSASSSTSSSSES